MLEIQDGKQANIIEAIDNYREEKWLKDDDLIRTWSRVLQTFRGIGPRKNAPSIRDAAKNDGDMDSSKSIQGAT